MLTATARRAAPSPAPRTAVVAAAHAAAFRALLGTAATVPEAARPDRFRADVSGLALAAMARTFDFDEGAIAVLDQAQFERCLVTVEQQRGGRAALVCADQLPDDLPPARRPPAR